jgi:hypothetical protein
MITITAAELANRLNDYYAPHEPLFVPFIFTAGTVAESTGQHLTPNEFQQFAELLADDGEANAAMNDAETYAAQTVTETR